MTKTMTRNWKSAIAKISLAALTLALAVAASAQTVLFAPGEFSGSKKQSYLGVNIADVTADRLAALQLKEERGVEVASVDQDAPAGKAGIKEHDVILEINGARVEGEEQLRRIIHETPPGRTVTLGISRGGNPLQVKVTLANRATMEQAETMKWRMIAPKVPRMPDMPDMPAFDVMVRSYSVSTGLMVDSLTPQLGEYFGIKDGKGILVRSVEKGSAAEKAGFKAGDVVIKVDGEKIEDRSDWRHAIRAKKGKSLSVVVVRDKREQTLSLAVPEESSKDESLNLEIEAPDVDLSELRELRRLKVELPRMEITKAMAITKVINKEEIEKELEKARKEIEKSREQIKKQIEKMKNEKWKEKEKVRLQLNQELESAGRT